jgi:hypothetical protein
MRLMSLCYVGVYTQQNVYWAVGNQVQAQNKYRFHTGIRSWCHTLNADVATLVIPYLEI